MPGEEPSGRIIEQRIRNRIVEQLELAGSVVAQREHQTAVPFVHVPYEVINGWEDLVRPGCWPLSGSPGALSIDEVDAVKAFNSVREVVTDEVPDDYPTLDEVQAIEGARLRDAAVTTLAVFAHRGRLPEDHEV